MKTMVNKLKIVENTFPPTQIEKKSKTKVMGTLQVLGRCTG